MKETIDSCSKTRLQSVFPNRGADPVGFRGGFSHTIFLAEVEEGMVNTTVATQGQHT